MATQVVRDMPPFDLDGGEDFTEYSERFEQFMLANKIDDDDDDMMRAVSCHQLGDRHTNCCVVCWVEK